MFRYIVRRLLWMIPVLLFISVITFSLAHAVPGGPFEREHRLPAEIVANLNKFYSLDQPLWKQYTMYMGRILLHFDFGPVYSSRSRTVNDIFAAHLPVSAELGVVALLIAVGLGVPLGVMAALRQNTLWDYLGMAIAVFGVSVPEIVLGPVLIVIFALTLRWVPVAGWGTPLQVLMPAFTLGLGSSAIIARLTRASMLQVSREDYVRTARAKGLQTRAVVMRHILRNAMIPVVTSFGMIVEGLVVGAVFLERVFAIPGFGNVTTTAIQTRDFPTILACTMFSALVIMVSNLVVDLLYPLLDPRVTIQ